MRTRRPHRSGALGASGWSSLAGGHTRSVRAVVTHDLLTGDAAALLRASPLVDVTVTDTVPLPPPAATEPRIRQISVAPLFAAAISSIVDETSISRLFE